ncbi:hypothetical protein Msil_3531 [Methylocella silvestris BL2]|uniref:Uncharacterized protein n=1 Tax=Methylocella silvestris (strain DSM 15510 / CIP 108128 / LMG 27833 / NCIMB 13906 / BL2) TaxID=395965 RepID=B8ETR8_METSB|nr:hypothetical protein [Methylocella silvestris]ACK52420.1 hypothetical protein Msil_3531 [Methylocella silvestris BL2]
MSLEPPRPNFMFEREPGPAALEEPLKLRIGLIVFAGVLAVGAVWMLLVALIAPPAIALPSDRQSASAAAAHRTSAQWAAWLGLIRGDLYAQAAFADAELAYLDKAGAEDPANAARIARARSNALTATSLSPVNGAAWLLLAELPAASGKGADANPAAPLFMSYFTAPNEPTLARARLDRALATRAGLDKDLQEFMKSDLRQILADGPQGKAAIFAAYKAASPQTQAVLESLSADVDRDFARSLRGEPPK